MKETDSTNRQAMMLEEALAVPGTLIVAGQQSQGRGRRGRTWESSPGTNLYMSLILKPDFSAEQAPMLTLLMAYSVAQALKECEQIEIQIKWPNDLLLNKKKICGILTEMSMDGSEIGRVVIGVGLNINEESFSEALSKIATSLKREVGREVEKAQILAEIMYKFEENYKEFCKAKDLSPIMDGYNQILVNKGKEVCILELGNEYHGIAHGINYKGELQVEKEDGTVESIFAGEVSVRGIYGYV